MESYRFSLVDENSIYKSSFNGNDYIKVGYLGKVVYNMYIGLQLNIGVLACS